MGNNQSEGCWWADKVQWDASQAPRDLATEHLGKCGQTDESRLGALPPKGRVTFSRDNMGLQWHRKHPLPPLPPPDTLQFCGPSPLLHLSIHTSISCSLPLSANFPGPECCSNCLLPFHSVTGQKTWQSSKSLVALHWSEMDENVTGFNKGKWLPTGNTVASMESWGYCACDMNIQVDKGKLKTQGSVNNLRY